MIDICFEDEPNTNFKRLYKVNFSSKTLMNEVLVTLKEEGGETGALIYQSFKSNFDSKTNIFSEIRSSELLWLGTMLAICSKVNLHSHGEKLCDRIMELERNRFQFASRFNS